MPPRRSATVYYAAMTEDERIEFAMADEDFVRSALRHATSDKAFVDAFLIDEEGNWKEENKIEAFAYLSPELKRDPKVIASAMGKDLCVMEWVPEDALSAMLMLLAQEDLEPGGGAWAGGVSEGICQGCSFRLTWRVRDRIYTLLSIYSTPTKLHPTHTQQR